MKIKKLLPLLGLSVALVGCGGQTSDDNASTDAAETTTVEAPVSEESTDQNTTDTNNQLQTTTDESVESMEVEDSNNN